MDERERIFQDAVERLDLAAVPTLGGWTRKLAEVEEHLAHGGKVKDGGCLVVQAGRRTDYRTEQAMDLMACLPEKRKGVALIFARYCEPWALDDYPGIQEEIRKVGLREDREGWQGWSKELSGAAGRYVGAFWQTARKRRVLKSA